MDQPLLLNTHIKLLASDFQTLTPTPTTPSTFSLRTNLLVSRVETLGTITSRTLKPDRFLRFTIDDGTGCIPCILWLNHLTSPYFSRRSPPDVRRIAEAARGFETLVEIGLTVRVRGKVTVYRGSVQLTVDAVVVERDPNAEILHWLECVRLATRCYDSLIPVP